jgi:dihydrofolate synthase/folylpolyglutamate synthase
VDYNSVIDFLFNQLANYQKIGSTAYKPGLDSINNLLNQIDNPHKKLKTIHLAGTNGKGSTSHILASILIENGYKVGLFTSPHIKDFRERIKINGKLISKELVVAFVNNNKPLFINLQPSFFEITTAMAFSIFEIQNCDICIIETGLGGRLDSTNVIHPELSIITNIAIEHTNFLGTTLPAIAKEKAGIIKPNIPLVIGCLQQETIEVFKTKAIETNSRLYVAKQNKIHKTDLLGSFQQENINTALTSIDILKQNGWYIDDAKSYIALTKIKRNTNFNGRLEQISSEPRILIDASHNPAGVKNLFIELDKLEYNNLHCIYGTSSDKDITSVMNNFPLEAQYYFTNFDSVRSMKADSLKKIGDNLSLTSSIFTSPEQALKAAKQNYTKGDLIIVFGSFFLLEKII